MSVPAEKYIVVICEMKWNKKQVPSVSCNEEKIIIVIYTNIIRMYNLFLYGNIHKKKKVV